MKEIVFLLEEASARAMLEILLPRMLSDGIGFRCIVFEGKQDLMSQMTRRIRGYQNPEARFVVLRDQDSAPDCRVVKSELLRLVRETGRADKSLVRIACRELEAFYLADLAAVGLALGLPKLAGEQNRQKFRAPDYLGSPCRELHFLTKGRYQKVGSSRAIAGHLALDNERSASFKNFIKAIRIMESDLLAIR